MYSNYAVLGFAPRKVHIAVASICVKAYWNSKPMTPCKPIQYLNFVGKIGITAKHKKVIFRWPFVRLYFWA